MSVIGHFILAKDGGWTGTIRTLLINAKVRLVPNDNRDQVNAPAYRVLIGYYRVGDAWEAQAANDQRSYLRLRLDDPSLAEPLSAALFPSDDGASAQLVWNRK
ncbi:DUF736 domain-containing protein [Nitrospirillum viridazoti]|uniref:Uncharacterized protein (DUF736 family) n=1 Tax=Nitrospirillum amazonense TaxID=28077 RepID=A0A560HSU2_9PROT|nr:DUF736 family protein [Nitrospirillum amazonense]TWB48254.1 uncharacterized protein (DUF736 family) [Nitrospirillum amazonense]